MELTAQQLWQIADEQKELKALRARVARLEEALKEIKQRAEFMNWGSVAKIASNALEEK